ncbi:MAG: LacI family DNA-binding transcriptional regulator [Roseiflexaceae bacterium]
MSDATIYDVAEIAGVSISTVSRVLNAPEQVQAATRMRVLAAIDQLNFVPRAEASARARKGNGRIGILAPFFTYLSFTDRLRGVVTALADSSYELVVYSVTSSAQRDGYLTRIALNRRLDGLIVMALTVDDTATRRLLAHDLATVLVEVSNPSFSCVQIDNEAGGRLAAEFLLQRGHCRCAFVGDSEVPDFAIHTSDWRLAGYRQSLLKAGLELQNAYIALAPHGMEQACQQAHQLLSLPDPPSAIFAPSDLQAMGVLKAARERELRVPNDLAVIGFDDAEIADYIGLTTIRQPLKESGRVAVDLLLARIADRSRPTQRVNLPLTLVQRETA